MESFIGIGNAVGPVVGSFIFEFLGYAWTFLIFGIMMAPATVILLFLQKPSDVKLKRGIEQPIETEQMLEVDVEQVDEENDKVDLEFEENDQSKKVTYC